MITLQQAGIAWQFRPAAFWSDDILDIIQSHLFSLPVAFASAPTPFAFGS